MDQDELFQVKNCACGNLRAVTRLVTNFYDRTLEPSGLQITQLILLTVISKLGPATINQVAEAMLMDPTTLNRNLKPLENKELVVSQTGEDHRTRLIALSEKGQACLDQNLPLWEKAQTRLVEGLGPEKFLAFLSDLRQVVELLR
jgi:DNA-binding MarR family transcriptional regulator